MTTRAAGHIAVIEQNHGWGDCIKHGETRDHCHCSIELAALRAGERRTCRHCGIAAEPTA